MMSMESFNGPSLEIFARAQDAARHIPPLWPLTESVAVNPFLGQSTEPLVTTAARMARVAGISVTQTRDAYAKAIARGDITPEDLTAALAAAPAGAPSTLGELRAAADRPAPVRVPVPTLADLAADVSGIDWPGLVAERMGHWAAGHFDTGQALWPAPKLGAFTSWKIHAQRDITPELHGLSGFCTTVSKTPMAARMALAHASDQLGLKSEAAEAYFHRLLTELGGWAQLARRPGWQAEQAGESDQTLTDLLTARVIWDAALWAQYGDKIAQRWEDAQDRFAAPLTPDADLIIDTVLQDAADIAAQRRLAEGFAGLTPAAVNDARPKVQAAFCIDVRSEVFRRALEATGDQIETLGFAGFFGLTMAHRGSASDVIEPRAPVLVSTGLCSTTVMSEPDDTALRIRNRAARAWGRFKLAAVSSFAFVEAAGPIYGVKLWRDTTHRNKLAPADVTPRLDPVPPLADRVNAAKTVLAAMSLNGPLARLVIVAGHGAGVTNNAHASALQCGACGGYAGDVNARLLAGLLNDPEVRAGLAEAGRPIPEDTLFVGGLHDTTTDALTLFDEDTPSPEHNEDLKALRKTLKAAGKLARTERAQRLPRAETQADIAERARDWAELRPEWGLAGCRAFVAAPRTRTAGLDLGGGVFLHSYDWQRDEGFGILELILTAPVVVASWISLQYYGSTVAPTLFGAGNKLLHNVTGGIGVVEGNGGVLRGGLPWQSVHDGDAPAHTPQRLAVVVEAPQAAISDILTKHPNVRELFDNGWLALFTMDENGRMSARYDKGDWVGMDGSANPVTVAA